MRFWAHFAVLAASACLLIIAAGCTAEQLAGIDQAVADANQAGQGLAAAAHGPAAALIPPEIRLLMELCGLTAAAAYTVWQQLRGGLLRKTAAAIIAGVESLPAEPQAQVKAAVKVEMKDRKIYQRARALVDKLKA